MNPENNSLSEIATEIYEHDGFTIIGHMTPDGDCIGSLIGLYLCLKRLGKSCNMLLQDTVPENYSFLNGSKEIYHLDNFPQLFNNIIFLDCSDIERSGKDIVSFLHQNKYECIINIDHHGTNNYFGQLNYVNPLAAATAEILFDLIKELKCPIDTSIANALYTALIMDTGNFQYSSTTSKTMITAARLLECNAEINKIRIAMYESKDIRELQILSKALSHMQLSEDKKVAWMYLTLEEVQSISAHDYHPEGIVNYLRSIENVEVAVYFREISKDITKIAFRSKNSINVAAIAKIFNGGGHNQAAGATFNGSLEQACSTVIKYIIKVINEQ